MKAGLARQLIGWNELVGPLLTFTHTHKIKIMKIVLGELIIRHIWFYVGTQGPNECGKLFFDSAYSFQCEVCVRLSDSRGEGWMKDKSSRDAKLQECLCSPRARVCRRMRVSPRFGTCSVLHVLEILIWPCPWLEAATTGCCSLWWSPGSIWFYSKTHW